MLPEGEKGIHFFFEGFCAILKENKMA